MFCRECIIQIRHGKFHIEASLLLITVTIEVLFENVTLTTIITTSARNNLKKSIPLKIERSSGV
jgi:hypothetical protein